MKKLDEDQRRLLAENLTPSELEEYELRSSPLAELLHDTLQLFSPTSDEFRAIYRIKRHAEESLGSVDAGGAKPNPEVVQRQVAEQMKLALGENRYADYEMMTDAGFELTTGVVSRLGLPAATSKQIWSVQKEFQAKIASVRAGNAREDPAATAKLYVDARERLTPLLGGDAGIALYMQSGGLWLQALDPQRKAGR